MALTGFVDGPLFALQEFTYGRPGSGATRGRPSGRWRGTREFAEDADPLLFTGEMMYPWMFEEIARAAAVPGRGRAAGCVRDWPPLYDLDRLAANEVPVAAAVYYDDMYVDAGLQLDTAGAVGNVRAWVTNEYEHDGLRVDGAAGAGPADGHGGRPV